MKNSLKTFAGVAAPAVVNAGFAVFGADQSEVIVANTMMAIAGTVLTSMTVSIPSSDRDANIVTAGLVAGTVGAAVGIADYSIAAGVGFAASIAASRAVAGAINHTVKTHRKAQESGLPEMIQDARQCVGAAVIGGAFALASAFAAYNHAPAHQEPVRGDLRVQTTGVCNNYKMDKPRTLPDGKTQLAVTLPKGCKLAADQ